MPARHGLRGLPVQQTHLRPPCRCPLHRRRQLLAGVHSQAAAGRRLLVAAAQARAAAPPSPLPGHPSEPPAARLALTLQRECSIGKNSIKNSNDVKSQASVRYSQPQCCQAQPSSHRQCLHTASNATCQSLPVCNGNPPAAGRRGRIASTLACSCAMDCLKTSRHALGTQAHSRWP